MKNQKKVIMALKLFITLFSFLVCLLTYAVEQLKGRMLLAFDKHIA